MENVLSIAPEVKENDYEAFEFMNSFGVIFKTKMFIHEFSTDVPIHLDSIRRVEIRKRRKYHKNILAFVLAAIIIVAAFKLSWPLMVKYIIGGVALLPVLIGALNVDYEYKFIIIRNYSFTEINVKKFLKDDAKKMAAKINKKLRTPQQVKHLPQKNAKKTVTHETF